MLQGKAKVLGQGEDESDDVTSEFLKGAYETLKIAEAVGAEIAILKARSPSCGASGIYNGTFNGIKRQGNGVTAELLLSKGIKVYTEENMNELNLK